MCLQVIIQPCRDCDVLPGWLLSSGSDVDVCASWKLTKIKCFVMARLGLAGNQLAHKRLQLVLIKVCLNTVTILFLVDI
jgi:hypothetical protein